MDEGEAIIFNRLEPSFVQASLDTLGEACQRHPQLRVKIAVDTVEKGYATHDHVADFLGLCAERWKEFYDHFQEGNVSRVPKTLHHIVPAEDLRYLTGFTDEQLDILERASKVPILITPGLGEHHPLMNELRVLMAFGVLLAGKHKHPRYKKYSLAASW